MWYTLLACGSGSMFLYSRSGAVTTVVRPVHSCYRGSDTLMNATHLMSCLVKPSQVGVMRLKLRRCGTHRVRFAVSVDTPYRRQTHTVRAVPGTNEPSRADCELCSKKWGSSGTDKGYMLPIQCPLTRRTSTVRLKSKARAFRFWSCC